MIKPFAKVGQSVINPAHYDVFVCGLALRMTFDDKDIAVQVAILLTKQSMERRNNVRHLIAFWWLMFASIAPWIGAWLFWKFAKGAK